MGLDTSHDCWHGSYSGFSAFRDVCATAAQEVFGYWPSYVDHPARAYQGWWDADHPYEHILDVFFVHSDCDGYIFPNDIEDLIPALEQLGPKIDPDWRERLDEFIAGLRRASLDWEIVVYH